MDFDDAKENIQPLATGRNASILQAAFRAESLQELQTQRHELEQAIHNYKGDDPLEAWYDYITWIEQSYPSGGKESGLEEVLTKCLISFERETRYHQDRRLIKLYIKFIDMHKDPTECYQQLFSEGIGTMVADLYISWAYCYDLCGNYRKADEIFRHGISCRAQPLEELQEAHQHFGFVVSQRVLYKDDANETKLANQQLNERRLALTSLRSHRKKVGSIRTGSAVKSLVPGTVQTDAINTSTRRCNAQVPVFCDENQNPNFLLPTTTAADAKNLEDEKKSVIRSIINATRDEENQKEPGPWNKAHDKKRGKLFTKNITNLGFSILEDNDTAETTTCEPVNTKEIAIEKGFNPFENFVSKNRPQPEWPTPVTIENEANPRTYPQYDKCKLYPRPNMEFQLEELLAYSWFRKRGIRNKFTNDRDAVWQNNNENIQQMRQYPNFAQKSRPQSQNTSDVFYVPEKVNGLKVNFIEIYNIDENQEMQFEEILYKRLRSGEHKLRYDANDTIIIATEMEETICMPQDIEPTKRRKSFFPTRKSVFQKNTHQREQLVKTDVDVDKVPTNDIKKTALLKDFTANIKQDALPNFEAEYVLQNLKKPFKIFDDNTPSTSKAAAAIPLIAQEISPSASKIETAVLPDVPENSFEFKTPALPTTNVKNEIDEKPVKDQLSVPKMPENGYFETDETCTTEVFNCFIKSQSVSTPNASQKVAPRIFGTVLKEKSELEPVLEVLSPEVTGATATAAATNSFSPLEPKQLSTILETSEHGTTKSISSPDYETDTKMTTARLVATQHTTNLETVKELSSEISTRTEQLLCNTLPNNTNIVMVDSTQVVALQPSTVNTPAAPRFGALNFAIFEDPTETNAAATVNMQAKQIGNFSRLEENEDTALGYAVRPIKFQEDKTETIPRIMYTSKQNVKFQEDKTETLPHVLIPFAKFEDGKNADTLSKIPMVLPEKMDDSFNFFTQTPPKFSKSINNQTSMISTNELLGFDVENSPIGGATAPKLKCNYNTPELRTKMFQFNEVDVNRDKSKITMLDESASFVQETQPSQQKFSNLKESFMKDISVIPETQPKNQKGLKNNEDSFIKDSQPIFITNTKLCQQAEKPVMKSVLRESFELPDFSIVMDSQPKENIETKWKENQNTPVPLKGKCSDAVTHNEQQKHILTDSFVKDFSAIKDPVQEPAANHSNHTTSLKFLAEKSICNLSKLKLTDSVTHKTKQPISKTEGAKEPNQPPLVEPSIQGKAMKKQMVDNFLQPPYAYGSNKINSSHFEVATKLDELFEYNAETAQFATNLSMIKNSTLLLQEKNKRQTQFHDKSLHIKDELHSRSENSFDTSIQVFKSPPSPRKSIAPKSSKLDFLSAGSNTSNAPVTDLSIDLTSDELAALQKVKSKTNRIDSSREIDHLNNDDDDDNDVYDDELSIYEKHTPKTPKYQRHIWNNDPQNEDGDDSNHFVHPETDLNHTQRIIENICLDGIVNPFDTDLINALLEKVDFINYIEKLPECNLVGRVKQIHKDSIVKVNDVQFKVLKLVGEGAYGAVFCATECKTKKKYALKQERPANYWEYYICLELRSRLTVDELVPAFMGVDYALVGNNASILISPFSTYGSLITVCNKIKRATLKNVDEYVVMHLTCQLLEIIDHLHATGIIHADIKADNFLLMEKLSYDRNHISLTLIDFGVSIDTRFFKKEQCFTFVHKDNTMKCIEMRENRPWTYQLDLYGLAGVIHVLLFGKYMDVEKNASGFWMHKTHMPRYFKKSLWEKIFKSLLNIRNCSSLSMPNLQNLRTLIKEEIAENENAVIKKIFDFNRALES